MRNSITGIVVLCLAAGLGAQFRQIVVERDPRPVEKFADAIQRICKCIVTYEDPSYLKYPYLIDVTKQVRKDGKSEPKVWSIPYYSLTFNYDASPGSNDAIAQNIEQALLQANSSRKDGVAFRLTRTGSLSFGEILHIIPVSGSILDTPVAGVLKQGTAFEVLRSIVNAVSRARLTKIGLNGMDKLLARTNVRSLMTRAPRSN